MGSRLWRVPSGGERRSARACGGYAGVRLFSCARRVLSFVRYLDGYGFPNGF